MDEELKALLEKAASHAADRKASLIRRERVLLDLLISDTSEDSAPASTNSSAAGRTHLPSRPSMKRGSVTPIQELLRRNHPDLTDEELEVLADTN